MRGVENIPALLITSRSRRVVCDRPCGNGNKRCWESINTVSQQGDWIKGEVIRIADNGYGTFQPKSGGSTLSIPPYKIKELRLMERQSVEVKTKLDNAGIKTLIEDIRLL